MNKKLKISAVVLLLVSIGVALYIYAVQTKNPVVQKTIQEITQSKPSINPLAIQAMRQRDYPGSDITIEQTLPPGTNYNQYIASFKSDSLKIYGLLTVPEGEKPKDGWPVIVFNHGFIPPRVYKTTERYGAYIDAFARNGYIVFKSDYRGNGDSEGRPEGAYYSPSYATDILNAVASIKKYKSANPNKIGMWGHSMGGNITLRNLVVHPKDIKAAVIWGGVVGNYDDLLNNWQRRVSYQPSPSDLALRNANRARFIKMFGTPQTNPEFWNSIDPTYFLSDITAPLQFHTGGSDEQVPPDFSQSLYKKLQALGKTVEYYNYPGDNHNISANLDIALQRSVDFFNKNLK